MKKIDKILSKIPNLLSSKISIFIYIFLFFYLVCIPAISVILPFLKNFIPSTSIQLILGNYTNVLSALGASIAAGAGIVTHQGIKKLNNSHEEFQKKLSELHEKIDAIDKLTKELEDE